MNPMDFFQGLGTELHTLWLVLIFVVRQLWKHFGKRLLEEHNEMYEQFKYEKMKDLSMQRKVPEFLKEKE